jgi:transposase
MAANPKQRRRHSADFKAQVLAACAEPGASVAAVALSFGLNDNLEHQWRRGRGVIPLRSSASTATAKEAPEFVALSLPEPSPVPPPSPAAAGLYEEIRLELKRGALVVCVTWPVSAAADCATWLRELLR